MDNPIQHKIDFEQNWDEFDKEPHIGEVYEFDYQFRDERKEVVKLIVVDVDETHVMYKMPSVSVNKIFPMHIDEWMKNTDQRRKVTPTAQVE